MADILANPHAVRREPMVWPPGLELTAFGLCVAQVVYLAAAFAFGSFLLDPTGARLADDFVGHWAAGQLTLDGRAAAVYDLATHRATGVAALGHDFDGSYPLYNPPYYLL